jgi:hypothetical protein
MIKLLGQLLVWSFLGVGAISAATAYLVSVDAITNADVAPLPATPDKDADPDADPDEEFALTLAAPTGKVVGSDGEFQPIAEKGDPVDQGLLDKLREEEVKQIRVKEFSFARWQGKWWFILSLVGLLAGALLTRWGARPAKASGQKADVGQSPDQIVDALQREVDRLRAELPKQKDRQVQLDMIVQRVGELQKTHMVALVEARDVLLARLGLGGYAVLMDNFAAAERQLNRAWSAAVDAAYEEAVLCLDESTGLIQNTRAALAVPIAEPV